MKLSIVMTAYNGEQYIGEQMESIRLQSRAPEEVLIIDDCSTDRTVEIVSQYIGEHGLGKTWRLERNPENKGWRRNFFEGFSRVSGDLVFPCDQDDIWKENKLAVMEELMSSRPEINVLTSNCEAFFEDGKTDIRPEPENGQLIRQKTSDRIFDTRYPGCTYCVRGTFLRKALPYWREGFPHDAFLWRLAMFSDSLFSINRALIRWRRHRTSTYTRESIQSKTLASKREWLEYGEESIASIRSFMEDTGCASDQKRQILDRADRWLSCRARFYDRKSPAAGLALLKYLKCYSKPRQFAGDWYLVYVKRK